MLLVLISILFLVSPLYGASIGNPIVNAKKGKFILGFEYTQTFKRRLEMKKYHGYDTVFAVDLNTANAEYTDIEHKMKDYSLDLDYGIFDWLGVFSKVGVREMEGRDDYSNTLGAAFRERNYRFTPNLSWCVGLKYLLTEDKNGFGIGITGQYMQFNSALSHLSLWDESNTREGTCGF